MIGALIRPTFEVTGTTWMPSDSATSEVSSANTNSSPPRARLLEIGLERVAKHVSRSRDTTDQGTTVLA
jgi:hypothetical protein